MRLLSFMKKKKTLRLAEQSHFDAIAIIIVIALSSLFCSFGFGLK